ncbi:MAG: CoA-binding protein [Vicingaceae bacterium]
MNSKKTVVIGATTNPSRYAYIAANRLVEHGHDIVPIGIKKGKVAGKNILNDKPSIEGVDTVTLYVGPTNQEEYYDYVVKLKPNRVVFNPGTENQEFEKLLENENIEVIQACTLVMLSANTY